MIDTHAHLTEEYYKNLDEVILSNLDKIDIIINSATNAKDSLEVVNIAEKYSKMYASVGIHPTEHGSVKDIEDLLLNPKVVAVGEIGLDFYHEPVNMDEQMELFIEQMELALKYNKPVIIHSRNATEKVTEVLKLYPSVTGVIHCFGGNIEEAAEYVKLGYKIGIGGVITFKNSDLSSVVAQLNLDNIVVETDSPFLSPEPYRGKKNQPYNVTEVYAKIAEVKNIEVTEVESRINKNVRAIFDF